MALFNVLRDFRNTTVGGPDRLTLDSEGNSFLAHSTLGTVFLRLPNGELRAKIKALEAVNNEHGVGSFSLKCVVYC